MNKTTTILALLVLFAMPFALAEELAIPDHHGDRPIDEINPTPEPIEPVQQEQTTSHSHRHYKGDLDKYGEFTFGATKRLVRFELNDNTYYFKLVGINIFGREIVMIYNADKQLVRWTWLKEDEGELFFYKTKFPTYEKEYLNYKIEPSKYFGTYRKITIYKPEVEQ